jgi:hypothetical protein
LLESRKRLRANQRRAVYQEAWSASHTNLLCQNRVGLNKFRIFTRIDALVKRSCIQPNFSRELLQVLLAKRALILPALLGKQLIVIFPIFALIRGAFRCFSSPGRFFA